MSIPVSIQSTNGLKFYRTVSSQWDLTRKVNLTQWFKNYLSMRNAVNTVQLTSWLGDRELTTTQEMQFWKEEADKISVRNYFINKVK